MNAQYSVNALDLEEVSLVDMACFLRGGQAAGIELLHSSPWTREWIARERSEAGEE